MKPFREWLSEDSWEANASIGGSFASGNIEDYYLTPWDLGYGHVVKFDHDFIGRSALERLASQPHKRKVWLRWSDEDVTRAIASSLFDGAVLDAHLGHLARAQRETQRDLLAP